MLQLLAIFLVNAPNTQAFFAVLTYWKIIFSKNISNLLDPGLSTSLKIWVIPALYPMKAVRWTGLSLLSLGKAFTFPRCLLDRFLGRKPLEPWRGAENFLCDCKWKKCVYLLKLKCLIFHIFNFEKKIIEYKSRLLKILHFTNCNTSYHLDCTTRKDRFTYKKLRLPKLTWL